jgi:hypothetical protein
MATKAKSVKINNTTYQEYVAEVFQYRFEQMAREEKKAKAKNGSLKYNGELPFYFADLATC